MAVLTRYRTATGAGVLTAIVLVLVFGSPMYRNWAAHSTNPATAGGWFLRLLGWPAWRFDSNDTFGNVLADDLKAILLVVLVGLFLMVTTGQQLARARGTLSQLLAGWSAYIFAAALAALLTTFIRSNPSLLTAFRAAGDGALYGLFTGWIIGIATLGHWRGTS
jgi:hypothetical protein